MSLDEAHSSMRVLGSSAMSVTLQLAAKTPAGRGSARRCADLGAGNALLAHSWLEDYGRGLLPNAVR